MTAQTSHSLKHIGSFSVILFLALLRPAAIWPEAPVSSAPLAVLSAWLLLFYKIHKTVGYHAFFLQHKTLLLMIASYFALCGASLIANYHRYPDPASFVRWGLTFPIIQSALVACGFMFFLPQNNRGISLSSAPSSVFTVLLIVMAIPAVALLQVLDNDSAFQFYRFTLAGDLGSKPDVIRGVLATSTDLGSVSAILALTALMISISLTQKKQWLPASLSLAIFLSNCAAGALSGSRGFFLSLGVGTLVAVYFYVGGRVKLFLLRVTPLILFSLLLALYLPDRVESSIAALSPALAALGIGVLPTREDFRVAGIDTILGYRYELWSRGVEQALAHPWMGISNGGYRLLNESIGESPLHNVHNTYLQLSIDAGVPALLLGALFLISLSRRAAGSSRLVVLATILTGSFFDNFADHSLPWIVISTYSIACCNEGLPRPGKKNGSITLRSNAAIAMASATLLALLVSHFHQRYRAYNAMPLAGQINHAANYLTSNYWDSPPILMSESLSRDLGTSRRAGMLRWYPSIRAADYCAYSYRNGKLLHMREEQRTVNAKSYRGMGERWGFTMGPPDNCVFGDAAVSEFSRWVTNYDDFYGEKLKTKNPSILLVTDYIAFFSPIFEAKHKQTLSLELTARDSNGVRPTLEMTFFDAISGAKLRVEHHLTELGAQQVEFLLRSTPSGAGYVKLKLRGWQSDGDRRAMQEIIISTASLSLK